MIQFNLILFANIFFLFKYDLGQKYYGPKFNPTRVRTHDLQIMTVHFMSIRRLLKPPIHQWLLRIHDMLLNQIFLQNKIEVYNPLYSHDWCIVQ